VNELFLVVFAHCSGGHGDTFSIKGVYSHFVTAMLIALSIENEHLGMTSIDHGAFVYRLSPNKTYNARNSDHCVFAFRHHPTLIFVKTWFDEELKRVYLDKN